MENSVLFSLVEWFSARTVRIRLPLLYVSPNENISTAGKVLVSCRLQLVSSRPLQIRPVQAMFARYVVQIELTCLY